jgi:hypothetical protein
MVVERAVYTSSLCFVPPATSGLDVPLPLSSPATLERGRALVDKYVMLTPGRVNVPRVGPPSSSK